jgi:hypothetical protein
MLAAIEFDDQSGLQTHEIRIETIDTMLAAEFVAQQPAIPKTLPYSAFGIGLKATQVAFAAVRSRPAHRIAPGAWPTMMSMEGLRDYQDCLSQA